MTQSLYPCLAYRDADAARRFLGEAFGFVDHAVHRDENEAIVHAEIALEGAIVMFGQEGAGSLELHSPASSEHGSACIYVAVADPAAIYEGARQAGVEVLRELNQTDYGSTEFTCRDPEGVFWSFGTYQPEG